MNFYAKIKQQLRVFFLVLAKKLGNEKPKGPIFRNSKSIIEKEIKIPAVVSFAVTVSLVYAMFVLDVGFSYFSVFASLIFTAIIAFFFILQIKGREREILNDNDAVVLMCILTITGILVLQISKEYVSAFIFPAGAFVIMSAMLLSVRVGMLYAVMMSLYAGMLSDMRFDVFFVMFCGGMAAIVNIEKVRRRSDFIMSGLTITVVNALVITMFYMLKGYSGDYYGDNLLYCFLNGAASTVIILALMPLFEKLFSRITNIKLIELSDFNNPLLKRLMLEAPGTYHHSLMTATIAEAAADAIGVNSLLARVGSYYHDIGKLKNPEYFIENQGSAVNPHDPLTPAMSSLILVSHVKDGAAIAKKHNLDKEIIDAIEQHHGTTMMHFFYHKALEINPDANIENFRYPGPKPKTKVSAIVMIADSCEAAARALEESSAVRIRETVEKIINNKFTDGQFSDCPITLQDLQTIRDSIAASLISIYHARIEYKNGEKKN